MELVVSSHGKCWIDEETGGLARLLGFCGEYSASPGHHYGHQPMPARRFHDKYRASSSVGFWFPSGMTIWPTKSVSDRPGILSVRTLVESHLIDRRPPLWLQVLLAASYLLWPPPGRRGSLCSSCFAPGTWFLSHTCHSDTSVDARGDLCVSVRGQIQIIRHQTRLKGIYLFPLVFRSDGKRPET